MDTADYIDMVEKHLAKEAIPSNYSELQKRWGQAKDLLPKFADLLSTNEINYIKSTINKRSVPTVKLLIKDHKKKNDETGRYPSRLVVPAANFTAGYPHVGQRGLKNILDKNKVDYMRKTIKQASQLKEDLEKLNITKQSSIVTLDIEAMYPSIQIGQVQRAVEYFLKDAPEEDKEKANSCLEMIKFGMSNTMITFAGKYYEYGGSDAESKGLTIGGYESAFLADLVAAFILENLEEMFQGDGGDTYSKIYRDDGIKVDMANKTTDEICDWYEEFQSRVNTLIGSDSLKFTMEIWKPNSPPEEVPRYSDKITICRNDAFPYLDLEMYWRNDELQFRVHLKPNQVLKYLNKDSAHTKATFQAIPHGVLRRLTSLTSVHEDNEDTTLDVLYPKHIEALERAGLPLPKVYPTLKEANEKLKNDTTLRSTEEEQKRRKMMQKDYKRATYFVIGRTTNFWDKPICAMIKELVMKHKLPWLRFKMANSRFTNLGELLNADLSKKVMTGITDEEMMDETCNCNALSLCEDGECLYGGDCRKKMVIYGLKDKTTDKIYYGKTVQHLKKRTSQHFQQVWSLVDYKRNPNDPKKKAAAMKSDSFAYHFAKLCGDCTNSNQSRAKLKQVVSVEVIWQGEPIQCTKSARTRACKICMVERKQIMKALRDDKHKVINENDDIYAACKCSTRFHKFAHIDSDALRTRLTQKKVTPKRKSKKACGHRKPVPPTGQENRQQTTPELVRLLESPNRLIDTNVPGLPYRSPCEHPSNLHLAQRRQWDFEQATQDTQGIDV